MLVGRRVKEKLSNSLARQQQTVFLHKFGKKNPTMQSRKSTCRSGFRGISAARQERSLTAIAYKQWRRALGVLGSLGALILNDLF